MARSTKGKRLARNNAVKRVRYAAKEQVKLKQQLKRAKRNQKQQKLKDIYKDISVEKGSTGKTPKLIVEKTDDGVVEKEELVFNSKTYQDQYGRFPSWMHPRERKRIKKGIRRKQVANKKKRKSGKTVRFST